MDSLQIAVAAYIAEHGSIDADTYQSLSDMYTTEISKTTMTNANAKRAIRADIALAYDQRQNNYDSHKHLRAAEIKEVNTNILSLKKIAAEVVGAAEKVAELKTLTPKASDKEIRDARTILSKFAGKLKLFGTMHKEFNKQFDEYDSKIK